MAESPRYSVQREVYQSRMRLPEDADAVQYRAVSGLAVFGLLVGLLSLCAFVYPYLWLVALAGVAANVVALRRIAAEAPALLGRKAAVVGVLLSLVVSIAVPTDWLLYRGLVRNEARQVATMWFDYLRADQPHKAHELTLEPGLRHRIDDRLWDQCPEGSELRKRIEMFVEMPTVRAILALGDKATIRYLGTEQQPLDKSDEVYQTYAVTYSDSEGLKTFFAGVELRRQVDEATKHAYWVIYNCHGGVKPKAFGGSGEIPRS